MMPYCGYSAAALATSCEVKIATDVLHYDVVQNTVLGETKRPKY